MKPKHILWMIDSAALIGWFAPVVSNEADNDAGGSLSVIETGPGVPRNSPTTLTAST